MPKFNILKSGVNEALIKQTETRVEQYMKELFHDYEVVKLEDVFTFTFGTITANIQILPWHSQDVLVKVYAYLGDENSEVTPELANELLRMNATIPFGSFGITFEKQAIFSYSLAGKNLDKNEFEAAAQMVAKTADEYDEIIKAGELVA